MYLCIGEYIYEIVKTIAIKVSDRATTKKGTKTTTKKTTAKKTTARKTIKRTTFKDGRAFK